MGIVNIFSQVFLCIVLKYQFVGSGDIFSPWYVELFFSCKDIKPIFELNEN